MRDLRIGCVRYRGKEKNGRGGITRKMGLIRWNQRIFEISKWQRN